MKRGIFIIPGFLSIFLSSCLKDDSEELRAEEQRLLEQYLIENNITAEPTSSGLYYLPIREGTGMQPGPGTWSEFEYIGELIDGTVFHTSDDSIAKANDIYYEDMLYGVTRMQVGTISLQGLNEGLQLMKVGGRAKFILPSKLALGSSSTSLIPSYSTLIYTIDLVEAFNDPDAHERALIQQFLIDSNFVTADSTDSGLYYIERVEGSGEFITDGDSADVWYTGYFFDGRIFDSNIEGEPYVVTIPSMYLIEGWNQGLRLMREGSKGILILPYYLGYGETGFWDNTGQMKIPPYMTLIFEVEIESVY